MKQTTAAKFYPDIKFAYTRQLLAEEIELLNATREQLEQEAPISLPEDIQIPESVHKLYVNWANTNKTFDVVTAYRSKQDFNQDFTFESHVQNGAALSLLLVNEFAVPKNIVNYKKEDLEELLERIINMARDDKDFKKHRKEFYNWQENIIKERFSNEDVLAKMHNMVETLNECIENRFKNRIKEEEYQYAFTLYKIGLAQSLSQGEHSNIFAINGSLLPRRPIAEVEDINSLTLFKNRPALMFHDVRDVLQQLGKYNANLQNS
jgi:hypothetical protein